MDRSSVDTDSAIPGLRLCPRVGEGLGQLFPELAICLFFASVSSLIEAKFVGVLTLSTWIIASMHHLQFTCLATALNEI